MNFELETFKNRKIDTNKLLEYGFNDFKGIYTYETNIFDNLFKAKIKIENNVVSCILIDNDTGDEYNLFRNERVVGEFVGKVRTEYQNLLIDIANKCSTKILFTSPQLERVDKYIRDKYHETPEYPWEKYPNFGIYRNSENNLWFVLSMDVSDNKLGENVPGRTVINVHIPKELFDKYLQMDNIYPGWHMNKKSWLSVSLNDSLSDELVYELIDISYSQTLNKKKVRKFPPERKKDEKERENN